MKRQVTDWGENLKHMYLKKKKQTNKPMINIQDQKTNNPIKNEQKTWIDT